MITANRLVIIRELCAFRVAKPLLCNLCIFVRVAATIRPTSCSTRRALQFGQHYRELSMSTYRPSDTRYETMRYNRCGRSGVKLPAISLGLWHNFGGVDTFENARTMILRAFDLGITHFDLANNYGPPPGSAEETFGHVVKHNLASHRDELIVSTNLWFA